MPYYFCLGAMLAYGVLGLAFDRNQFDQKE